MPKVSQWTLSIFAAVQFHLIRVVCNVTLPWLSVSSSSEEEAGIAGWSSCHINTVHTGNQCAMNMLSGPSPKQSGHLQGGESWHSIQLTWCFHYSPAPRLQRKWALWAHIQEIETFVLNTVSNSTQLYYSVWNKFLSSRLLSCVKLWPFSLFSFKSHYKCSAEILVSCHWMIMRHCLSMSHAKALQCTIWHAVQWIIGTDKAQCESGSGGEQWSPCQEQHDPWYGT